MMLDVVPHQSAWHTTFPHRAYPQPDEWLPGFLLRCDEMNHRNSGTTFRYLLRSTFHPRYGRNSSLVVVPESLLHGLAHMLEIPWEVLLATTFQSELARLYSPRIPQYEQLVGKREKSFYICPLCVAQSCMLGRALTLPYLKYCPTHHIEFQSRCICGKWLRLFEPESLPFTCVYCGLDWGKLPQIQISPELIKSEKDLYMLYEFFLVQGTCEMKLNILSNVRKYIEDNKLSYLKLIYGANVYRNGYYTHIMSLSYIVDLVLSIGFSLKDIVYGGVLSF